MCSTERQVQAVLAVLLICISFEIAGKPFHLVNKRFQVLGRLELSTLFVQWATMWSGSMIYASQDAASKDFVIALTVIAGGLNIGMLIWLILQLLVECANEKHEDAQKSKAEGKDAGRVSEMMSDLSDSIKRWRFGRMSNEGRQSRLRRQTFDAGDGNTSANPALQIEMVETTSVTINTGEIKVDDDHALNMVTNPSIANDSNWTSQRTRL